VTHEYDQHRARTHNTSTTDNDMVEPGQSSRSALLRKPEHAIASGLVQRKAGDASGRPLDAAPPINRTGLPDALKQGIEARSGFSMDAVKVHYNSSAPAARGALAYAQGTDIYIGPGQEAHLGHEAWHVVQQLQGRVRGSPGTDGTATNEETALEQEASAMGAQAASSSASPEVPLRHAMPAQPVVQMVITGEARVPVTNIQQPGSNHCWATVGWCIHQFAGGALYASLKDFVDGQGTADAKTKFANDQPTDVDQIIGSQSKYNRLSGSDAAGSFSKTVITKTLNAGKPILVNVNGEHYVILCGKRSNDSKYEVELMDPATGTKAWYDTTPDTTSGLKITAAGAYSLTVFYYLS
jgi:hypothetical protein